MKEKKCTQSIRWGKALLNGLLVIVIAFGLFMLPGMIKAFRMGFALGPQLQDSAEVSRQISESISTMYKGNKLLITGYVVATLLLIFWRAWAVSRGTGNKSLINGILVSVFPILLSVLFMLNGFSFQDLVEPLLFAGAGLAGGLPAKKQSGQTPETQSQG